MNGTITLSLQNYRAQYPLIMTGTSIKELKEEMTPPHYNSLMNIWKILKNDVLCPLTLSKNNEDFDRRIESALPEFLNLRVAIFSVLMSYYKDGIEQFGDEVTSTLNLLEENVEKKAVKYFDAPGILTLQSILFTIRRITTRSIQWAIKNKNKVVKKSETLEKLSHFIILLDLHLTFIFSVIEGEIKLRRKGLIQISLNKAKEYSNKYFHYAKKVGILAPSKKRKIIFPRELSKEEIEEDKKLSEAGLTYYSKMLQREDKNG